MSQESLSESDTRAKLITPALRDRGWTEDMIRREETPGEITKTDCGIRHGAKKVDYLLRIPGTPIPVALIEAKKNTASPAAGLEQAKDYARRFNVPFVYSSNGYMFVEYDAVNRIERAPQKVQIFPTPELLQKRYEEYIGVSLSDPVASPLTVPYSNGDSSRRYYQDAAIRAALEKIAYDAKINKPARILLNLATGAGKTFIAVHLLKKIFDAGNMTRALFLCDRDALRSQALLNFQSAFGSDAEVARRLPNGDNLAKNARIHIATYQTLGISGEADDDITFARDHYPRDYFSHIIIDECHRSLRNDWAEILKDNQNAVHIGLTATPRQLRDENEEDREISSRNIQYFGESVYSYSLTQGAKDGYLALCEIRQSDVDIDKTGLSVQDIMKLNPTNYHTGELLTEDEIKAMYENKDYENILMLPDRVHAMCNDLFNQLIAKGDPRQKTIIFCVRRGHAEMVSRELNNRYAAWCKENNKTMANPYAFVCMSQQGSEQLADFRSEDNHHFVAATVDLLTTGVDIPAARNIVFFCYIKSPIRSQQMMGRGARIDATRGKLSFNVYDYTRATDLLDKDWTPPRPSRGGGGSGEDPPTLAQVDGLDICVEKGNNYILAMDEESGREIKLDADEYRNRLVRRLGQKIKTIDDLRTAWIDPQARQALLQFLRDMRYSPRALAALLNMRAYDEYDIIAESAYGVMAMTRRERADAFNYKNTRWLNNQPANVAELLRALTQQFAGNGIEELESPDVFDIPAIKQAGGIAALAEASNDPQGLLLEAKRRLFAA